MSNELARRIRLDVSTNSTTGTDGAWTQIKGITDLNFPIVPTKVDATSYDTNGWKDFDVTLNEWNGTIKCNRQSTSGVQDAGQLLLTARVGKFAPNNTIFVRWYDKNGESEPSYWGTALVEQSQSKTGVGDLDGDQFIFTGKAAATAITNPYASPAVPIILSASPSAQSVGKILTILGSGFASVTATASNVTIGGTNATSFIVESDQMIVAVMPAGSAGSAPIIVTAARASARPRAGPLGCSTSCGAPMFAIRNADGASWRTTA